MTDSGQLTFKTMGGDTVPVRGKHYVQPRGYAHFPGGGPASETCGSCQHIQRYRRWAKCALARAVRTGGRGSDILVRAPACSKWEADEPRPSSDPKATVKQTTSVRLADALRSHRNGGQ